MTAEGPRPRPGILDIAPYVPGRATAPGAAQRPAIKLSSNESPLGPSPRAIDAYRALADSLHRYPDGGAVGLREAIGAHHGLDPARIVCGAGSDEILALLARAYAGPGDEVLYSQYGFLVYRLATLGVGATPVTAPERDLRADVDALLARVTPRTRIVFLANPNNPTGSCLPATEIERLHRGLPADVLLVLDAAYAEYVGADDYEPGLALAKSQANVVMTRTFSKIHGLAALRLGWVFGPAKVIDALNRLRGPFNVTAPALAAGAAALADQAHVAAARRHNERWLPWLAAAIEALGPAVYPSAGNFVLVRFASEAVAADAAAFMMDRGVIPRPLREYGLGDCLRITVGLEAENKAAVDALADFME